MDRASWVASSHKFTRVVVSRPTRSRTRRPSRCWSITSRYATRNVQASMSSIVAPAVSSRSTVEVRFLDDIVGLILGGSKPSSESPELAASSLIEVGDPARQPVGRRGGRSGLGCLVRVLCHVHDLLTQGSAKSQRSIATPGSRARHGGAPVHGQCDRRPGFGCTAAYHRMAPRGRRGSLPVLRREGVDAMAVLERKAATPAVSVEATSRSHRKRPPPGRAPSKAGHGTPRTRRPGVPIESDRDRVRPWDREPATR